MLLKMVIIAMLLIHEDIDDQKLELRFCVGMADADWWLFELADAEYADEDVETMKINIGP